jgi:hypothetical protein
MNGHEHNSDEVCSKRRGGGFKFLWHTVLIDDNPVRPAGRCAHAAAKVPPRGQQQNWIDRQG